MMEYEDLEYYWIVLCKNNHYHKKQHLSARHHIVLGATDAVSPPPCLEKAFKVTCEDCGKEYSYTPRELLRYEMEEAPPSFSAHPLFADFDSMPIPPPTVLTPTGNPASSFTQIVRNLFQRSH